MSEFIDREKAIAKIKAAYCCGCENYNGIRCRACQIMDAMDVLEDEPAGAPETFPLWTPIPELPGERPKKLYWREKSMYDDLPRLRV